MRAAKWEFRIFWRLPLFMWARPWGAAGWTPTLRQWRIWPVTVTRFYAPVKNASDPDQEAA